MKGPLVSGKRRYLSRLKLFAHAGQQIHEQVSFTKNKPGDIFLKPSFPCLSGKVIYMDTLRRNIIKRARRRLHFWYFTLLLMSITAKPKEIRMGKGKGAFSHWIGVFFSRRIIFSFYFFGRYSWMITSNCINAVRSRCRTSPWWLVKFFFFMQLKKISFNPTSLFFGSIV